MMVHSITPLLFAYFTCLEILSQYKQVELDEKLTLYGVYIKKKISRVVALATCIDPQLTDEEYLSQRKLFERDEIFTQYGIYIEKKILHVSLIHVIVKTGGITASHAGRAFSPRLLAVLF